MKSLTVMAYFILIVYGKYFSLICITTPKIMTKAQHNIVMFHK